MENKQTQAEEEVGIDAMMLIEQREGTMEQREETTMEELLGPREETMEQREATMEQREETMEALIEKRVEMLVRQRFAEQTEQMEARLAQHQADTWAIFQPLTGYLFEVFSFWTTLLFVGRPLVEKATMIEYARLMDEVEFIPVGSATPAWCPFKGEADCRRKIPYVRRGHFMTHIEVF